MTPLLANWITLNTRKDIVYMDMLYESGSVSASRKLVATGELLVTLPPAGSLECTSLLTGSTVKVDEFSMRTEEVTTTPIESSVKTEVCATPTSKNIRCGSQGLVWWEKFNKCDSLAFALADETSFPFGATVAPAWSLRKQDKSYAPPITADAANGKFEYDQIVMYNNNIDVLGKKLVLELSNPIPSSGKYYLLDMGSQYSSPEKYWRYYIDNGTPKCLIN